jgi:hypothetical protein
MRTNTQRACVWCGPVTFVLFFIGFIVAGWIPVPTPGEGAQKIVHDYQSHADAIRIGLLIAIFGAALYGPFAAMLAGQLRTRERGQHAASYLQLILGGLLILEIIIPLLVLETAAFRPGRSPEITLALSDLGWIMLVTFVYTIVVELVFLGIAILQDTSARPVFPRWMGTSSIVAAVLFIPGSFPIFFKNGPFAWSGLLGFWIPAIAFGIWVVIMAWLMLQNIDRDLDMAAAETDSDIDRTIEALSGELAELQAALAGIMAVDRGTEA